MGVIWEGAYNKVTFLRSFVQALEALCDEELGAYNEADPAAGGLCLPNELWRSCPRTPGVSADLAQHMPDPLAGALHAIILWLSLMTVACHLRYGSG